jgi:cell division protein FtsZ
MGAALARAAKESGAQVFAFVTLPFDCEGSVRFSQARQALDRLQPHCDFLFVQPHQDFCASHSENLSLTEVYAPSNRRLIAGVRHVAAALTGATIMGIGFGDLCAMMRERSAPLMFAVGGNDGANRGGAVVEELLAHPRLGGGKLLAEAETVSVSLVGAQDLRMADVNKVMQELGNHWRGTSHLLSASVGSAASGPLSALLLILTQEAARTASRLSTSVGGTKEDSESSAFATHYLSKPDETKSTPRFSTTADSAPATPRIRGSRVRGNAPRMRQGQLELDMINKGRFEKSEPTIHKGEDLDVPTFIRRGVVLN